MEFSDSDFPYSPTNWDMQVARSIAIEQKLDLTNDHWPIIASLQEYFAKHIVSNRRELTDALEEKFHQQGGMKYLYLLFPAGPVAQGSILAGLIPPSGSIDKSFGSVV